MQVNRGAADHYNDQHSSCNIVTRGLRVPPRASEDGFSNGGSDGRGVTLAAGASDDSSLSCFTYG